MAFIHPVIGVLALLAMGLAAVLGFRSRAGEAGRGANRKRHRALGPWALGAMIAAGCSGLASTVWLRDDLGAATTWHARLALVAITLAGLAALLSRWLPRTKPVRTIHPVVGALALLVGLLAGILGIELLP